MRNKKTNFPEAVFFDCDGVLADNEKEGHQVAFNATFRWFDLPICWDDELYGKLVKIGGGKERLQYYFENSGWPKITHGHQDFIERLHSKKTQFYTELIEAGKIKIRPGIENFINLLIGKGIPYGICSTSQEIAVKRLVNALLTPEANKNLALLLAGDVAKAKKPDPEIYILAAKKLNVASKNCVVIEDSEMGTKAAKAAGMRVVVTKSFYTRNDNFDGADLILQNLEELLLSGTGKNYLSALHHFFSEKNRKE